DDLQGVSLGERTAEHGEILREDVDQTAFHASVAGDKTVSVILLLLHAEVVAAMRDQLVGLLESTLVEQKFDALAGRHLALFVLALAALCATAFQRHLVSLFQFGNFLFEFHSQTL